MSGRKGANYERELVRTLDALGFGALRLPSSGSATSRDLPDVLVGQPTESGHASLWAVEAKCGSDTTLYCSDAEVQALRRFAETWGATPYLSARFTSRSHPTAHFLVRPENARRTDSGLYGLPVEDIEDRASMRFEP